MKSWKRRFFIITEDSFGYYKNVEVLNNYSVDILHFTGLSIVVLFLCGLFLGVVAVVNKPL